MSDQKDIVLRYRCPSCGQLAYTETHRKKGQMKSLTGNVDLRCKTCRAQAKPRMKPIAWVIQGIDYAVALAGLLAWKILDSATDLNVSNWSIPWLISVILILLLSVPLRIPFMRITRYGAFEDTLYDTQVVGTGKTPDLYDVCATTYQGEEMVVAVMKKRGRTLRLRVVSPEAKRKILKVGDKLQLENTEMSLEIISAGTKEKTDR